MIKTGPLGTFLMNLVNPFCGSPAVSLSASSLTLNKYSALIMAVSTSLAVYAIGRPICSVSSFAKTSFRAERSCNAFSTILCRCANDVCLYSLNASVTSNNNLVTSFSDRPCRVKIGSFVIGDMVLRISAAMIFDTAVVVVINLLFLTQGT